MRIRIALLALLFSGVSAIGRAADPSPEPPADVDCRMNKGTANLSAEGGPQGTSLKLALASSHGTASFTFKSVTPTRLKFHFPDMRAMWSFTLTDGKQTFHTRLPSSGPRVAHWDKAGNSTSNQALAAVTMVMETNEKGDMDIAVSTAPGVALGKDLKVSWVQCSHGIRKK